ncbi:MAG: hypothetical protein ACKO3T_24900 [Planctomycetaceae bacterium]
MSSVTKSSVVIRVLPAVGLALLLTAPASSFGDGMRGMLPWGGKKDYQPLEAREKADESADESVEESEEQSAEQSKSGAGTKRPAARPGVAAAGTSGGAAPAKRSSWSPFGRTAGSGSEPAASPAADAQKKPGLFRNPFRREPVKPADPFAGGNAAESEESAESEEQEEAADAGRKTASGSRVVKSAAGPAVRPVVGRGAKEMQAAEAAAEQDIEFMAGADDESSADAAAAELLQRMERKAVVNPAGRVSRAATTAADRTRRTVDRSLNAAAELEEDMSEAGLPDESLVAETVAEPLIRQNRPTRQITRTAAAVEEQKLQELDALISGGAGRVTKSASKVTSAALQKTQVATEKVQAGKTAVQRAGKAREDAVLREFDELTGRAAEAEQSVRSTARRGVQRTEQMVEELEFPLEEADESAADLEIGGEPELAAEDDLAAEMESTEDSESAADAEFSMEHEAVTEREAVRQPQPRSRRAAEVPAVGAGAAGPAGSRVRAATDGFEWQSGSKSGSKSAALKSSAKPTNTRTASLTREIASPGEDLEQVEEWLSSPVSAPVPPQSSRSQIRRSSYADPFVDADGEGDAGAASGAGEMAEEELEEGSAESGVPAAEVLDLPEPPAAGAMMVPASGAGVAEAEAAAAGSQSVLSRLSPVSWGILAVGTVCIFALLFFPSRRKAGTNGTAVIPA